MNDVLLTANGDLDLSTGDFQIAVDGRTTQQHKRDILLAASGDFKEFPAVGVGAVEYLGDENPGLFLREVRKQMQADGMTVERIEFDASGGLIIEGGYEND